MASISEIIQGSTVAYFKRTFSLKGHSAQVSLIRDGEMYELSSESVIRYVNTLSIGDTIRTIDIMLTDRQLVRVVLISENGLSAIVSRGFKVVHKTIN